MNLRAPALIALAGLSTLALAACSGPAAGPDASAAPTAQGEAFTVVATTTQVADFTRELTDGLNVEVTQLLQPGMSAHSFEPTPADLVALGSADLVVSSGAGLEEWLDAAVSSSGYAGEVVDASASVTLSGSHEHDHGDEAHGDEAHSHAEGEEHSHEEGEEHSHAEETTAAEGEDHEHAEGNPHTWTSPANAKLMAAEIATHLEELPGIDAAAVQANADAYDAELTELDTWIAANVDAVPEAERVVVTNHDALHYYLEQYGITFVGSIMPSFDDSAEPSAAEIDALIAEIKEHNVKAIFTETQLSPQNAETIAAQTGAKVFSGDKALATDALGEPGTPTGTYVGATVHNTQMIIESWGATATDVPEALAQQ
ncbi:metal ABC transporter substrate-binding protein [Pseudoclavibacter helvolus]|uniref:metal ABC transporter substrate-binding protein n=1 Tax=Pseudoclavibacter helvolus TaxID=255205 RepID=UPI003C748292